jgi:hypothetical protein
MTASEFRRLALTLPDAVESRHMGHPDFRVGGRVFATLGYPGAGSGMVRLPTDEQEFFVRTQPAAFAVASGAWGRAGATTIQLRAARKAAVREALAIAWRARAPKRLLRNGHSRDWRSDV